MKYLSSISNSEWQIMRVIWTLKKCTSRQIIRIMNSKIKWKASTVKTLITRLERKKLVGSHRTKRRNLYFPRIDEQRAADLVVMNVFHNICPMHAGSAINHLLMRKNFQISKGDVQKLIHTLQKIEPGAPDHVKCNCLVTSPKEDHQDENEE